MSTFLSPALFILSACLGAPQEGKKHTIEATVKEIPAKEKDPAGFSCEATTDLPDGCQVDVFAYFGPPVVATHIHRTSLAVKDGKVSAVFSVLKDRNLAGEYTVRFRFDPGFQAQRFSNLPRIDRDVIVRVGTDADAARDRLEVGRRMIAHMESLVAIADEAVKRGDAQDRPDAAGWKALRGQWFNRAKAINVDVQKTFEYRMYKYGDIVDRGFEDLSHMVMDLCDCARDGRANDIREGRERVHIMLAKYRALLIDQPLDAKTARIDVADSARKALNACVFGSDDRQPAARKNFIQLMLKLGSIATPESKPKILEISASANELFEAIEAKKDARELYGKIDARLGELLSGFQNEK